MTNETIIAEQIEQILSKNIDFGSESGGMVSVKRFSNIAKDIVSLISHTINQARAEGLPSKSKDDAIAKFDEILKNENMLISHLGRERINQAAINLFETARAEGENFILNVMQEHIKENDYTHYDCFLCTIVRRLRSEIEEAARQSALAEIGERELRLREDIVEDVRNELEELKNMFSELLDLKDHNAKKDAELGKLRADLAHEKNSVTELLENQKEYAEEISQFRDGVRKLKNIRDSLIKCANFIEEKYG